MRANAVDRRLLTTKPQEQTDTNPYANASLTNPAPVPASSAGPPEGYTGSIGVPVPEWARNRVEAKVPAGVDMKEATSNAEGYMDDFRRTLIYLQATAADQAKNHDEELARMRSAHAAEIERKKAELEENKASMSADRDAAVRQTKEELAAIHARQLEEEKAAALLSGYEHGKYATIEHDRAVAATKAQIEQRRKKEEDDRAAIKQSMARSVATSLSHIDRNSRFSQPHLNIAAVESIKKLKKKLQESGGYTPSEIKAIIDEQKAKIKDKKLLAGVDSDTGGDLNGEEEEDIPGSSMAVAAAAPIKPSVLRNTAVKLPLIDTSKAGSISLGDALANAMAGPDMDQQSPLMDLTPLSASFAIDEIVANAEIGAKGKGKKKNGTSSLPNGITNWQIDNIFGDEPRYVGTISRDQIRTIAPLIHHAIDQYGECGFIMNLDRLDQQLYEHWVAVFIDADHAKAVYYYDPFGEPLKFKMVKDDLDAVVKSLHLPYYLGYYENHTKNQNYSSNRCGIFSIMFIQNMLNGSSFSHACKVKEPDAMQEQRILEGHGYL